MIRIPAVRCEPERAPVSLKGESPFRLVEHKHDRVAVAEVADGFARLGRFGIIARRAVGIDGPGAPFRVHAVLEHVGTYRTNTRLGTYHTNTRLGVYRTNTRLLSALGFSNESRACKYLPFLFLNSCVFLLP